MDLSFWAATDIGRKRTHNEDNFLVDQKLSLFVVADGMGGHASGEIASQMAVNEFRGAVDSRRDIIDAYARHDTGVTTHDVLGVLEYAVQTAGFAIFDTIRFIKPTCRIICNGLTASIATVILLAVKLSPYYTSLPHFVRQLANRGVDGLVLFNRFYQPDFDIEDLKIANTLELSISNDLRLPLRWISILQSQVNADFALTSGVHTYQSVLKAMMAGAKVAMLASELLHNGIGRIPEILDDLTVWMEEHEYISIKQMQGSMSQKSVAEPAAFERANYMKVLGSYQQDLP